MTDTNGYIILHRSIMSWEWYGDVKTRSLFIHLLLSARWEDTRCMGQVIKRGQLCTTVGAIEAYNPEKGYMFTTYLNLQLKCRIRDILRLNDPLNREETRSLDAPLDLGSEESDTLHDITADPTSGAGFERVEMTDYYTPQHKALDSLPPVDHDVIHLRFFSLPDEVMSYSDIGERLGISLECVRQRLNNSLNKLRRGKMGVWLRKI